MSHGKWLRPASAPRPTVWRTFQGKLPLANGVVPRFRIQDCPDDMKADVVDHMIKYFLHDEPICENLRVYEEESALAELKESWNLFLADNIALVALLDNPEEVGDADLPVFAGCNILGVQLPDTPYPVLQSPRAKKFFSFMEQFTDECNCFEKYNVPAYMYGLGLSVHPGYRGQGIGLEIIKSRFALGRKVGIGLTVTVFTNIASQKLAQRAGFDTLMTIDYDTYTDEKGEVVFKNMQTKSSILMAAVLDDRWKQ